MISHTHNKPRTALCAFTIAFISTAIMMVFAPDGAGAASLQLGAKPVPGTINVLVSVGGARQANGVSLYVDGHLAQHDRKWPWRFGREGKIAVGHGRHRVSVSAHLPRHVNVSRSVVVNAPRDAEHSSTEATPPSAAPSNPSHAGRPIKSQESARVESKPVDPPELSIPEPEPQTPEPEPEEKEEPSSPLEPESAPPAESSTPESPGANLLWNGSYDTGSLFQWELIQQAAPGRISVVDSPTDPTNDVARFEVRPEDSIGDTSPRAEVGKYLGEKEGEERYYRWYTYFPESFPTNYPNSFITFTQWRAVDESEDYTSFMLWGDRLELRREGTKWSTKLTKGVWHKFVYHVKWSPDPNVGFIELFYDGQLVLPETHVRTMGGTVANPVENYVKQGLYKSEEIPTGVLYQDGFVSGTSYEAVNNAPS